MAVALDRKFRSKPGSSEKIPALAPCWMLPIRFVQYQVPPVDNNGAATEEWLERANFIEEDLCKVLRMSHEQFWCQMVFDVSLHKCIDSFLRYAPKPHDNTFILSESMQAKQNSLLRLVFMICLRMSTHKESKADFITPSVFGDILYENFLFDIPKLMDLCVLFGGENSGLMKKMLNNIFTQQPKYTDDLKEAVPTILNVLSTICLKCGVDIDSAPSSPQKLTSSGKSSLLNLPVSEFQDIVFYVSDTTQTLSSFLDIYEKAAVFFTLDDFPEKWCQKIEAIVGALSSAISKREWSSPELRSLLRSKLNSTLASAARVFHCFVFQNTLQLLMDGSGDVQQLCDLYLHLMTSVLNEHRVLAVHELLFPFNDDQNLIRQCAPTIDDTQLLFIENGIQAACCTYSNQMTKSKRPKQKQSAVEAAPPPPPYTIEPITSDEAVGACSVQISGVELDSLISSVQDLLPDLGAGFIERCLAEMDYSAERVINALLEDKLPSSLANLDRMLQRSKPTEESQSLLEERRNIFDNDEFDVFSKSSVDTSRIHQGKKEKAEGMAVLEDKSHLSNFQDVYNRYGSEDVESIYDKVIEYEDEYDDTYDSHEVGADDADSADELTAKSVRWVNGNPNRIGKEKVVSEDEDNSEDEASVKQNRDNFIEDPAKIRERQAQRRATQQAKRGKGPAQPKKYDVVGQAKGQGQSAEVLRNRAFKEKNKNRNRQAGADRKRRV